MFKKKIMNKKLSLAIVAGSITFIVAALNMNLGTQKSSSVSLNLNSIESLANDECDCDDENDPIALHGSLAVIPVKSYSQPFHATRYSSYIKVDCLISLSSITVKVVNATGQTVYSSTVNPVAGEQLYISLAGLSSGDYTLVFSAPNGNSMYGDFEI
jgi:hypothetical protein